MYPRIVRQMPFMGRGALGAVVVNSALCKCTSSWLLAPGLVIPNRAGSPVRNLLSRRRHRSDPPSKLPPRNSFRSNVSPQRLGNYHASIGLLVVLHNRNPGAAHGQPAAVQRMQEFRLVLAFRAIADVGPPRLVRLEIRARGNLAVQLLPRQPDLKIICLRRR